MLKLTQYSLPVVFALCLAACSSTPKLPDDNATAAQLYAEAKEALDANNLEDGIKKMETLESRYPYGSYAQQAEMDIAYANYRLPDMPSAIAACDRFIKQYPNHPNVDYAYYLKGLANFNSDATGLLEFAGQDLSERDQHSAHEAFNTFRELVTRFPESRYVPDAREKMKLLVEAMAKHEILVARYYMTRRAPLAAVNRAKTVLSDFSNTTWVEEALAIMMNGYDELGLPALRDDARRVLEKSYPTSRFLAANNK